MNTSEIGGLVGLIGGIAGGVLGLAGGLFGAYRSIKYTKGPRERSFVIKVCVAVLLSCVLILGLLLIIPPAWNWCLFLPFFAVLFPLSRHWNARQATIRNEEAQQQAIGASVALPDRGCQD